MTRVGWAIVLVIVTMALPATAAQAATVTIGSTLASTPSTNVGSCGSIDCVWFQTDAGVPTAVVPADGVITTWRVKSGSSGNAVMLRVLRPGSGGSYTAVGTSDSHTVSGSNVPDAFTTNLVVNKGDVIALDDANSGLFFATAGSTFVVNWFAAGGPGPALADGSSAKPNNSQSGLELMLNADVVLDSADLSITNTDSPDPVGAGQQLTYLLTVANAGPRPSKAVAISDPLPSGITLVSATPSSGTCTTGPTVSCQLGTLAANANATVAIVVTPAAAGDLTDTATVSSATTDPNAGNDSATTATTVTAKAQPVPKASVAKLKITPRRFRLGGKLPSSAAYRKPPVGTTISFVASKATKVTLRFDRVARHGKFRAAGTLTRNAQAGLNRLRFQGRLTAKRKLKPAKYRLSVTPVGVSGAKPLRARFQLLPH